MPKKQRRKDAYYRQSAKFPYMRERLDIDYVHKLSPEEKKWLSDAMHGMYHSGNTLPQEMQRACWREFKAAQRDLYSRGEPFGRGGELPLVEPRREDYYSTEDALIAEIDERRAAEVQAADNTDETQLVDYYIGRDRVKA